VLAARAKDGINAGGGIPFEFNVPAPCDALAEGNEGMRYVKLVASAAKGAYLDL